MSRPFKPFAERDAKIKKQVAEIEELRAAICDEFEILENEQFETFVRRCDGRNSTHAATILRVLKEKQKEQRNEH